MGGIVSGFLVHHQLETHFLHLKLFGVGGGCLGRPQLLGEDSLELGEMPLLGQRLGCLLGWMTSSEVDS